MRRCEALLAMGADVRGSPAHEQLTRQVQQFITVSMALIRLRFRAGRKWSPSSTQAWLH